VAVRSSVVRESAKNRSTAIKMALIAASVLFALAAILLLYKVWAYWKQTPEGVYAPYQEDTVGNTEDTDKMPNPDWVKLKQANSACIGWICIPGTKINYPIVKGGNANKGEREWWLHHDFEGHQSSYGAIATDLDGGLDEANNFIYGHNMADGSMFHDLNKYLEGSYLKDHAYAYIVTPDRSMRLVITSVSLVPGNKSRFWLRNDFGDKAELRRYLEEFYKNSEVKSADGKNVIRGKGQNFCLYTCYGADDRYRVLVMAQQEH
jgi:sortase B